MGYSFTMRAPNAMALKEMIAFMEKNYTVPEKVFGKEYNGSRLAHNRPENGLSYDHHRYAFGFDYSSWIPEPEREYIYMVTRWMALKSGALKKFKELDIPVPYVSYDSCEKWPVLDEAVWGEKAPERWAWTLVSSTAFRPTWEKWVGVPAYDELKTKKEKKAYVTELSNAHKDLYGYNFTELDRILRREMRRLERLWNER